MDSSAEVATDNEDYVKFTPDSCLGHMTGDFQLQRMERNPDVPDEQQQRDHQAKEVQSDEHHADDCDAQNLQPPIEDLHLPRDRVLPLRLYALVPVPCEFARSVNDGD